MYLKAGRTYYRGTEQHACRGDFLLLLQLPGMDKTGPEHTYACVRKVALRQLGHFMMGRANIAGQWVTVSGSYGSDGLPMTVKALPKDAKPLPRELYDAWNKGGGWNGAGSEAQAMRDWAIDKLICRFPE